MILVYKSCGKLFFFQSRDTIESRYQANRPIIIIAPQDNIPALVVLCHFLKNIIKIISYNGIVFCNMSDFIFYNCILP
ncbi:hypothetical protein AD949_00100 [Acetobacter orleanensis]|nr:hypothetical protein AD949_00100 [Acetobacter orleanensis]